MRNAFTPPAEAPIAMIEEAMTNSNPDKRSLTRPNDGSSRSVDIARGGICQGRATMVVQVVTWAALHERGVLVEQFRKAQMVLAIRRALSDVRWLRDAPMLEIARQ